MRIFLHIVRKCFSLTQKTCFCILGFMSWETKFGMVVLHGNVQKSTTALFRFLFLRQLRSKLPKKSQKIVKLRIKNEKIKMKSPALICFHFVMNNHANFPPPTLKNRGAKFRSQNVSPFAGTSSNIRPVSNIAALDLHHRSAAPT